MIVGVPKESYPDEARVALSPESVKDFIKLGYEVLIESGAGDEADFVDAAYKEAGASITKSNEKVWKSDIVAHVRPPSEEELGKMKKGAIFIGFFWPAQNQALMEQAQQKGVTIVAMDTVPRISRAQKMDALSSMAGIAGYRAVVEAASQFERYFTGQVTAAGKVPPAKILIIGAGVAGLAAIGAAKGMGAVVRAFDTRMAAKEQVESLGGEFLVLEFEESGEGEGGYAKTMSKEFIDAEMALFAEQAKEVDVIITTALIPGKPAPKLITKEMVESMRRGSVIIDLAAEQGGNCELTEPHKVVEKEGVKIVGYTDFPSKMAVQSSTLYANNIRNFVTELTPEKDGVPVVNLEDEVIRGATSVHEGEILWPAPAPKLSVAPQKAPEPVVAKEPAKPKIPADKLSLYATVAACVTIMIVGGSAPTEFLSHLTVFILACFVGWQVVWNVSHALHTPLMSVTNAISGIIVVGALLTVGAPGFWVTTLSAIAVLIATINISGGFLVTRRMLAMFRK